MRRFVFKVEYTPDDYVEATQTSYEIVSEEAQSVTKDLREGSYRVTRMNWGDEDLANILDPINQVASTDADVRPDAGGRPVRQNFFVTVHLPYDKFN